MIHAGRPQLAGQPHTGPGTQLIAVHPQPQAARPTGLQHLPGLGLVERSLLTEHVNPVDVGGNRIQHVPAHQVHIVVRVCPDRRHVGPQECHVIYPGGGNAGSSAFRFHIQPITGFGFQGGSSPGAGGIDPVV